MDEKIIIVIGNESARKRFDDFYHQSIFLAKSGLLRRANKANLILETDHYYIHFVPNTNMDRLKGLRCHWAYGFNPTSTKYLEFRTSEKLKSNKPLVENVKELFNYINEMEGDAYGDEGN